MSVISCLLFQLARDVRGKFPDNWCSPDRKNRIQGTLEEIFEARLELISRFEDAHLLNGIALSNVLIWGPDYVPCSVLKRTRGDGEKEIRNFICLGSELAGLDLSGSTLESVLLCGSPESALHSECANFSSSRMHNAILAYANLNGASFRKTVFEDALIRNCMIEQAEFIDYEIGRSLCICNDKPDGGHPVRRSIFMCEEDQKPGCDFILKNINLEGCTFLGSFQPTSLMGVRFIGCRFGGIKPEGRQFNGCRIKALPKVDSNECLEWNIESSDMSSCSFEGFRGGSVRISENSGLEDLSLIDCKMESVSLESGSSIAGPFKINSCPSLGALLFDESCRFEQSGSLSVEASTIGELRLESKGVSAESGRPRLNVIAGKKPTFISRPDLSGVTICGELDQLHLGSAKTGKECVLAGCRINGARLTKGFFNAGTRFDLADTVFNEENSKSRMILESVDFSGCRFDGTVFKGCDFINCSFPLIAAEKDRKPLIKEFRARFVNCSFKGEELSKADFSNCRFECSQEYEKERRNAQDMEFRQFDYRRIAGCSFADAEVNSPFSRHAITKTDFKGLVLGKTDGPALKNCVITRCTGLSMKNASASECSFEGASDSKLVLRLEGNVRLEGCVFSSCDIGLSKGTEAGFSEDCSLESTNVSAEHPGAAVCRFSRTKLLGCRLSRLKLKNNAFFFGEIGKGPQNNPCVLTECQFISVADSKTERDPVGVINSMKIGDVRLESCVFNKNRMCLQNSKITGKIVISEGKIGRGDKELPDYHISAQNCFDAFSKEGEGLFLNIERPSARQYIVHGRVWWDSGLPVPSGSPSIEVDPGTYAPRQYSDWSRENPLYDEYQASTMKDIWGDKKGIYQLGHQWLGYLRNPDEKPQIDSEKLVEDIKNNQNLNLILTDESVKEMHKNLDGFRTAVEKAGGAKGLKSEANRSLRNSALDSAAAAVRCTRLKTIEALPDSLHRWIKQELNNVDLTWDGEEDLKVYADFGLLMRWMRLVYIVEVKQHADGRFMIAARREGKDLKLILGDEGSVSDKGFVARTRDRVMAFLNEPKQNDLLLFARTWIIPSKERKGLISFSATDSEGFAKFWYNGKAWGESGEQAPIPVHPGSRYEIYLPLLDEGTHQ